MKKIGKREVEGRKCGREGGVLGRGRGREEQNEDEKEKIP